jgi:hypothetical protein
MYGRIIENRGKFVLRIAIILCLLVVCGETLRSKETESTKPPEDPFESVISVMDKSYIIKVITNRNHSFVELNCDGTEVFFADLVLAALNEFEDNNPQLVIKRWQPQFHRVGDVKFGFWVDHQPREKSQ